MDNHTTLYGGSAIPTILKIARERSTNENMRTKKALADALGTTPYRIAYIEAGVKQINLEDALEWCKVTEDRTAHKAILHAYGYGLPPTDPRLLQSLPNQLVNYIEQAKQGIEAAEKLLSISTQLRPHQRLDEYLVNDIQRLAEEILDTDQAAECVLESIRINLDVDIEDIRYRWIREALADEVVINTVSKMDEIQREAIGI
ncbi:hypothetical protein GCM10011391_28450 [Pullulanibacillus camelliae]|uniref:Uncharacterized protein n=1 Tax=Pullulanibacillus camelliae TaxID=1707096 RepID=A0A8J2YJW2_9BACL|nr:hypothetical protein [Pullulanibacillus camelliae]GGE47976.1 hypothetical protein GCM10011391_28450 [Pullulanibacillus camelliae]